jgi:hypothetical protein
VHLAGDWLAFLMAGVGAGIGIALAGSVIHDAFSNQHQQP